MEQVLAGRVDVLTVNMRQLTVLDVCFVQYLVKLAAVRLFALHVGLLEQAAPCFYILVRVF